MNDPRKRPQQPQAVGETEAERWALLRRFEQWLEWPVIVLGFVWLILLLGELVWGLRPLLARLINIIWVIFIIDFLIRFVLAPRKFAFMRRNWLTAISLIVPAFRMFRIFRAVRSLQAMQVTRSLRLVRVVASLNRGLRALGASLGQHGFGYVVAFTVIVIVIGAAGMYAFERGVQPGSDFDTYLGALWWTAMMVITSGSRDWPLSGAGRVLGFLVALYGFVVFGYVAATLASFFISEEARSRRSGLAGSSSLESLRQEIAGLREELKGSSDGVNEDRRP